MKLFVSSVAALALMVVAVGCGGSKPDPAPISSGTPAAAHGAPTTPGADGKTEEAKPAEDGKTEEAKPAEDAKTEDKPAEKTEDKPAEKTEEKPAEKTEEAK